MRSRSLVLASLGILLSIAGCSSTPSGAPSAATSREAASPEAARPSGSLGSSGPVNPANFTSKIDNHWYPLAPGTTLTYRGVKDRKLADRAVAVTDRTIVIAGVTCVVVEDKLFFAGEPAERNFDYYAQDRQGNVWSFGEDAQEIESGQVVATEGWRAGLDGALPSLVMEAAPAVGDAFANDYTKDHFAVVSLAESVKVPYGAFTDALLTKEWAPIEREVLTHKYYVRGIGEVRDVAVRGPNEEFVLVAVAR
jgi:hypothetical protein